jgi:hypothetical protein
MPGLPMDIFFIHVPALACPIHACRPTWPAHARSCLLHLTQMNISQILFTNKSSYNKTYEDTLFTQQNSLTKKETMNNVFYAQRLYPLVVEWIFKSLIYWKFYSLHDTLIYETSTRSKTRESSHTDNNQNYQGLVKRTYSITYGSFMKGLIHQFSG